ncbi:diaminopimelate decarboxylase [bacterium]|nr:MAG: diaminopimelate decarboxylase [bacterium]
MTSPNTPRYEYSRSAVSESIAQFKNLSAPYGLTVRYAVKANPHPEIVKMINEAGISFDSSSSYEAAELLKQGVAGDRISLSSQQLAHNLPELLNQSVKFVATSVNQLNAFVNTPTRPTAVAVRINPDIGYGHNNRTSTGGRNASFGIWHEYINEVLQLTNTHNITIDRVHIHVGSGADPSVWGEVMDKSLDIVEKFPNATILDIGGGFKIHRYGDEQEANLVQIMTVFSDKLSEFEQRTKRQVHLEIEPGTYFIAHAGTLVAYIDDIVDTGTDGFTFIKLNTGMNDFLRSSLYGARHKIEVINDSAETLDYIVVGHNCESGDILSPAAGNPEVIETRTLKKADIGDEVRIYDTGAYCASMRAKGYNSFPEAEEIMVD